MLRGFFLMGYEEMTRSNHDFFLHKGNKYVTFVRSNALITHFYSFAHQKILIVHGKNQNSEI